MMRTVFLFLLCCYFTKAEYGAKCANNSESHLTLSPTNDGVEGRYKVEWCTEAPKNVTRWELVLRYDDRPPEKCKVLRYRNPDEKHSHVNEQVEIELNCTNICFETNLDLIFNGSCYYMRAMLHQNHYTTTPYTAAQYISNEYNKEYFTNSKPMVYSENKGEDLKITWFLHHIPATYYTVIIYNDTCNHDYEGQQCYKTLKDCVTKDKGHSVECHVRMPYGCYLVSLSHLAPWTSTSLGPLQRQITVNRKLCHNDSKALGVTPIDTTQSATSTVLWTCGGVLVVALTAALFVYVACRLRDNADLKKQVLGQWLNRKDREPHAKPLHNIKVIVLLYARDCGQLMRAAKILRTLLERATGCQVIDLYTSDTVSAAAPASAEWVRSVLRSDDARVLLLQTPAAESLFCASLDTGSPARPTLCAPLIGRRVMYQEPHPSDNSFALALRQLSETAHVHPQPYRKYYVAEISNLKADIVKGITPLRRYILPDAAVQLLKDLAPTMANSITNDQVLVDLHQQFSTAVDELKAYVQNNPDYLSEELLYL